MDIKIDKSQLLALAGDNPEMLVPIIEQFRENSIQLIESMKASLVSADHARIAEYAHQLKGSSGTLGMVSLYNSCVDLESHSGKVTDEVTLVDLLDQVKVSAQWALSSLSD